MWYLIALGAILFAVLVSIAASIFALGRELRRLEEEEEP